MSHCARTGYDDEAWDYLRGLHSGFPVCCVEFFVHEYWNAAPRFGDWYRKQMAAYRAKTGADGGYVPCPECLVAGVSVEAHTCVESCRYAVGSCVWWPDGMSRDEAFDMGLA